MTRLQSFIQQPSDTGANIKLEFGGDFDYSLSRSKYKADEVGLPDGSAQLVSGGHSIARMKVTEAIITAAPKTPDEIIWDELDELVRLYTSSQQVHKLRLYLNENGGYVDCTGWMTTYDAQRGAQDGQAIITVSFDFLIKTKDTAQIRSG